MTTTYANVSDINNRMIAVYNNMFLAVVNSLLVSLAVSSSPELMKFLFSGFMKWIVIFSPLVMILAMTWIIEKATYGEARGMLHIFAALMGVSLSAIFVVYTTASIVSAFMGAAVLFGTMSLWGYFTKQSLESWGSFLLVGLIAVIIASVVNVFLGNSTLQLVVSAVAIIVFLGLTAYDTQRIREAVSILEPDSKAEILGALSLYMNFINIFTSLLQLFGSRDD
jgi:FtsH-binding integral membrane protein